MKKVYVYIALALLLSSSSELCGQTLTNGVVLIGDDGNKLTLSAPTALTTGRVRFPGNAAALGGMLYVSDVNGSTRSLTWLNPGSDGQVLTLSGGVPTWTALSATNSWNIIGNGHTVTDGTDNLLGTTTAAPLRLITGGTTRITIGATGGMTVAGTSGTSNVTLSSLASATGTTGRVMFATDATGTLNALATPVSNGQILTSTTGGVLSWTSSPTLNFWGLSGNTATTAGTNFLGTTDNVAFEIHVDEAGTATEGRRRVMRYEPNATSANIIGGFSSNGLGLGTTAVGVTIAGGGLTTLGNRASDNFGFVGGGAFNRAGSNDATVTNAQHATVVGGLSNNASGSESFVGGGNGNIASGAQSSLVGGGGSTASGANSSVGGGGTNVASGQYSTISGGSSNNTTGVASSVLGGASNTAGGDYTSVAGGRGLTLSAAGSFGFLGNNGAGANNATVTSANTAYLGNVDLWLFSNDNTARQMRFYETQNTNNAFPAAGINYTAFQAGTLSNDLIYTLPTNTPGANSLLYSSGGTSSALSWTGTGSNGQVMTLVAGVPTWSSTPTIDYVQYNVSAAQATSSPRSKYLFNVAYNTSDATAGAAVGAVIAAAATGLTNTAATGLTVTATATGNATATGLAVTAASGTGTRNAIDATGDVRLLSASGTASKVSFQNPAATFATTMVAGAQTANINYRLPLADAAIADYALLSDGAGNLSWGEPTAVNSFASSRDNFEDFIFDEYAGSGSNDNQYSFTKVSAVNGGISDVDGIAVLANETNDMMGMHQLGTGTSSNATGQAILSGFDQVNKLRLGGKIVVYETRARIETLSTAAASAVSMFGIVDGDQTGTNNDPVNGVYVKYTDGGTNGGKWEFKTSSGGTSTAVAGPTVVALQWDKIRFAVNAAGTQVDFYVNDVLAGSSTTNIPTVALRPLMKIRKNSSSTTSRTISFDWIILRMVR